MSNLERDQENQSEDNLSQMLRKKIKKKRGNLSSLHLSTNLSFRMFS